MMEGRETDLEYNLLMGLTGASVSKQSQRLRGCYPNAHQKWRKMDKDHFHIYRPTPRRHSYLLYGNDRCGGRNAKTNRANDSL